MYFCELKHYKIITIFSPSLIVLILLLDTINITMSIMCVCVYFQISVIADDLEEIAREVAQFSQWYNHVITSGGVGPTHDDMTFEGMDKGCFKSALFLSA